MGTPTKVKPKPIKKVKTYPTSGKVTYYDDESIDSRWSGITKSGDKFDEDKKTAAILPEYWDKYKGKKLKVTNPKNNKSVVVEVNDTGGFGKYDRVLDLSKSAFESISDTDKGVGNFKIEVLEEPKKYKVKKGDTLSEIAKEQGTTVDKIQEANDIKDPDKIYEGQNLDIAFRQKRTQRPQIIKKVSTQSKPKIIKKVSTQPKPTKIKEESLDDIPVLETLKEEPSKKIISPGQELENFETRLAIHLGVNTTEELDKFLQRKTPKVMPKGLEIPKEFKGKEIETPLQDIKGIKSPKDLANWLTKPVIGFEGQRTVPRYERLTREGLFWSTLANAGIQGAKALGQLARMYKQRPIGTKFYTYRNRLLEKLGIRKKLPLRKLTKVEWDSFANKFPAKAARISPDIFKKELGKRTAGMGGVVKPKTYLSTSEIAKTTGQKLSKEGFKDALGRAIGDKKLNVLWKDFLNYKSDALEPIESFESWLSQNKFMQKWETQQPTEQPLIEGNVKIKPKRDFADEINGKERLFIAGKYYNVPVKYAKKYVDSGEAFVRKIEKKGNITKKQYVDTTEHLIDKSKKVKTEQPLIEEAKKYGSAEEFVESQGKPLYHGTPYDLTGDKLSIEYSGSNMENEQGALFFTDNKIIAKNYSSLPQSEMEAISNRQNKLISQRIAAGMTEEQARKGGQIIKVYIQPKNPLIRDAKGKFSGDLIERHQDLIKKAKKQGNDVVIIKNVAESNNARSELGTTYAVLDESAIKTKSQLTDIYKQAQKTKTEQPLIEEDKGLEELDILIKKIREKSEKYADLYWKKRQDELSPKQKKQFNVLDKEIKKLQKKINKLQKTTNEFIERKVKEGKPYELTQREFVQYHKTGAIDPSAYEVETKESLKWIKKENHPKKYGTKKFGEEELEIRGEPSRSQDFVTSIVAFSGNDAVGFVSNEFGATGVWVAKEYQKKGIGTYLLQEFQKQYKAERKLGQMTPVGIKLTKAYHRNLVKNAIGEGKNIPQRVLKDYPDIYKQAQGEKPTEMYGGIPLHPEKFVIDDVIPTATKVISTGKGMSKSIRNFFAPESTSKKTYRAGITIRQEMAKRARATEKFAKDSEKRLMFWDKIREQDKLEFMVNMESGNVQPKLKPLAKEYRKILDKSYELSKTLNEKIDYIQNYFPHMWDRDSVRGVKNYLKRYKTRVGKEKFSKLRTIDLIKEGLANGFKLKSTNPEEIINARYASGLRAKMNADMIRRLEEQGLISKVEDIKTKDVGKAAIQTPLGIYEGQPEIVTLLNRKLQPSLYELDNWFGDVMKGALQAKNMYTAYLLGMSGFHAVEVTISDIAMQGILTAKEIARGNPVKAFKRASKAIAQPAISVAKGKKIQDAYYGKDAPEWAKKASDYLVRAGGRVTMPSIYKVKGKQAFMKAIHNKNVIGAIPRAVKLALEASMKPILEYYVPKLKVANFYKLTSDWLRNHPNVTEDQIDEYLARTWDLMDYNFGQVVYDNLFWQRWARDVGVMSTLSLGWNLGTIRLFGGAPIDIVTNLKRIKNGSKDPAYMDRILMNWAYVSVVALLGSLITYLSTGERPKEIKDFFAPRTGGVDDEGNPNRVVIPAMTKEFLASAEAFRKYGVVKGVPKYASHKLSPALSEAIDVFITNKNYYGADIKDPDAPAIEQVEQIIDYFLQKRPISISSLERQLRYNKNLKPWKKVLPFMGFTSAPKYVTRTKLQKEIFEIMESRFKRDYTREEWEKIKKKSGLRKKIKEGTAKSKDILQAIEDGIIKGDTGRRLLRSIEVFIENAKLPKDVRVFKYLSNDEQKHLYLKMNDKEKRRYVPYMNKSLLEELLKNIVSGAE